MARRRGLAQRFQIAIVEHRRTHRDQQQLMHWERDALDWRWHQLTVGVAADNRYIALVKPPSARNVHSRSSRFCVPLALFCTAGPAAGADKDDVAGTYFDASLFLPRFEIRRIDRCGQLQIGNALQSWDV